MRYFGNICGCRTISWQLWEYSSPLPPLQR